METPNTGRFNDLPLVEKALIISQYKCLYSFVTTWESIYYIYSINRYYVYVEIDTRHHEVLGINIIHDIQNHEIIDMICNNIIPVRTLKDNLPISLWINDQIII